MADPAPGAEQRRYPAAERQDIIEQVGQRPVPDPYRWLEDATSARTHTWLTEQVELFRQLRSGWPDRPRLLAAVDRLASFDRLSAPRWAAEQAFYSCLPPGAQHTTLVVEAGGRRRVLVDPQQLDPTGQTVLGSWQPSPDGRLVAYQLATGGAEEFDLYLMEVSTGRLVDGPIGGCRYSAVAWLPGGSPAYYVVRRVDGHPGIYLHTIAAEQPAHRVFGSDYPDTADFDVMVAPDGSRLVVLAWDGLSFSNEVWHADLGRPEAPALTRLTTCRDGWTAVWPGRNGTLYLLSDDAAPRGQLVRVELDEAADERPTVLVEQDPVATLDGFAILDGDTLDPPQLLVLASAGGHSRLRRHRLSDGQPLGEVRLPGAGAITDLSCLPTGGSRAWFVYSDPVTPETVYHYDASTDQAQPWQPIPALDIPAVVVGDRTYRSADGTPVRLILLQPAEAERRPLPTILQGYGAFGESQLADYYAAALAWVGCGGAFALAAVRGGGEQGQDWHLAGARDNKQHSIDDFLAAAEYLIGEGITEPGRLGAFGQSAGGLLVAAAMAQRPHQFAAVAVTAGLYDMARYELFGMGGHWAEEFGSRDEPAELDWLLGYSPYHRLSPDAQYPAVLLTAFEQDTRVDPLHSRKLCAALQHATGQPLTSRPVLLNYQSGAGHGDRDRESGLNYFADVLAFFARYLQLGQS
ncbi:MAG TPA: prolyl oligopeptidase family serine peptidase [Jatrophihabitans sp.]|nr:prolyl oligopeptidase family serine peptidase [Jatrophihabitans sp.]